MRNPFRAIEDFANGIDQAVRRQADEWNVKTDGFVGMLWRTWDNFNKRGLWEASALSYYSLLSLFPLLLILVVGLGRVIGTQTTGNQIENFLTIFLPGPTATELSSTIKRFVSEGSQASIVALITLAWSALGLFSALSGSMDRIFRTSKRVKFWERRIYGLIMVLVLGVLLVANIVASLIFSFLNVIFLNQQNIWLQIASLFVPFGFSLGIFAMMYRWIPRSKVRWDAIWTAALIGGIAWEVAKRLFALYLDLIANVSLVYGSIATVIIFMIWAYYTWSIVLICGELCMSLADWLDYLGTKETQTRQPFAGDYYIRQLAWPEAGPGLEAGGGPSLGPGGPKT
jgi:membrane protein